VLLSVQLFITTPYTYQRVLLRFAQPVLFSGAGLVYYSIIESTAALTVLSLVAGGGLAYGAWRLWKASPSTSSALSKIAPAEDEATSSALAPALMKDEKDLWDKEIPSVHPVAQYKEERAPSPTGCEHEAPVSVLFSADYDKWSCEKRTLTPALLHEVQDRVSSVEDSAYQLSAEDILSADGGDGGDGDAALASAYLDDGAPSASAITKGMAIDAPDRMPSLCTGLHDNRTRTTVAEVARRLSRGGVESDDESFQQLLLESARDSEGDVDSEFGAVELVGDEAKVTSPADGSDYSSSGGVRDASSSQSEHSLPAQRSQEGSWYSSDAGSTESGAIHAWLDDDDLSDDD
jgi:hypothetical protein